MTCHKGHTLHPCHISSTGSTIPLGVEGPELEPAWHCQECRRTVKAEDRGEWRKAAEVRGDG